MHPLALRALCASIAAASGILATVSHAALVEYRVDLVVTADSFGLVGVGNAHSVNLVIESNSPDTDAASGVFATTNPGALDTNLAVTGIGSMDSIAADSSSGTWTAAGFVTPPLVGTLPWELELIGLGLSPDQPLPDFTSLISGGFNGGDGVGTVFNADVVSIALIPEPTTALLLGVGLAWLAGTRRRQI